VNPAAVKARLRSKFGDPKMVDLPLYIEEVWSIYQTLSDDGNGDGSDATGEGGGAIEGEGILQESLP
jgi:hypothetical protein